MHEHIVIRDHNVVVNYPHLFDRRAAIEESADWLAKLRERGVGAVVDLTTVDLGRDIGFMEEVSRLSGMPVIAATGIWKAPPAYFVRRDIETLVDCFRVDVEQGIAGTGVKAGIIKLATDVEGLTPGIEMALRAGARAHRATGVPISTHTAVKHHTGDIQQRIFREEGVDLSRTIIGHSGDSRDLDYLKRLMENGSYIGMDRFGLTHSSVDSHPDLDGRVATVAALCKAGYAERMVISHDASCCHEGFPPDHAILRNNRDWHLFFISDSVLPAFRAAGISEGEIQRMCVENPRRLFEQQGAY
jgi:phosphotriesterase-related protein